MLTDSKLKNIKPTGRAFKVADRDGVYVLVSAVGGVSFRYNYRLNGRQETMVLGSYGVGGISLSEAREVFLRARRLPTVPSTGARSTVYSRLSLVMSRSAMACVSAACACCLRVPMTSSSRWLAVSWAWVFWSLASAVWYWASGYVR